jgi:hypothetical protein
MLCEVCHGRRVIWRNGQPQPCPACGGLGEFNCCEGESGPPPPQEDNRRPPDATSEPEA